MEVIERIQHRRGFNTENEMSTLFNGGRIFDGMGTILDDHAVLVEDQKIQRIAPQGEFSGFDGEVFDVSGGTLLLGLIDCHVHLV